MPLPSLPRRRWLRRKNENARSFDTTERGAYMKTIWQ